MVRSSLALISTLPETLEPSFLPAPPDKPAEPPKLTVTVTGQRLGSPLGSPTLQVTLPCNSPTTPACRPFFVVTVLPPPTLPWTPVPSLPETKPPPAFLSVLMAVPDLLVVVTLLLFVAMTLPSSRSRPFFVVIALDDPSKFVVFTVCVCDTPFVLSSLALEVSMPALLPSARSTSTDFFSSCDTLPPSETWVFFSSPARTVVLPLVTSLSRDWVLL